jgi:hypothetical protein
MTYENQIKESHPMRHNKVEVYAAEEMAMKLVGERHEKRELVNLVRWLIMDRAGIVNNDIIKTDVFIEDVILSTIKKEKNSDSLYVIASLCIDKMVELDKPGVLSALSKKSIDAIYEIAKSNTSL